MANKKVIITHPDMYTTDEKGKTIRLEKGEQSFEVSMADSLIKRGVAKEPEKAKK